YVVSAVGNDTESTNSLEVSATPLISATQNLGPLADTYVRDGTYTNSNFGTATNLYVKTNSSSFNREIFLRFDVSGLADAQAVQLQLWCVGTDTSGSSTTLAFEFVSDDSWSETSTTWRTKPAGSGLVFTNLSGCTAGQPVKVDLTGLARLEAAGDGLLSLRIAAITTGTTSGVDFGSRENPVPGNRPILAFVLSAPPPPPVLSVLLQGNTVEISWPAGYPTYVLQKLPEPLNSSSNAWQDVSGVVSNFYSEPLTNTTCLFRLKSP
ncbi:MAG: DNRLRE domain-containing protein, partial [Verrucomicrobia bacterium]|nr:DNRLRE domain-containing protein [Verrucomicrobiota bacterium]